MSLKVDYEAVAGVVADVKTTMSSNDIEGGYDSVINALTESKGDQITAVKELLMTEKELAVQLNKTLIMFAEKVQAAAGELQKLDQSGANTIQRDIGKQGC